MAIGHGSGKDKAAEAAKAVISSPLLETSISGARRLLINITMSEDIMASDVDTANDEMTITVIAAGYGDDVSVAGEDEDVIPIDNPLIDNPNDKKDTSDDDLDEILRMLEK